MLMLVLVSLAMVRLQTDFLNSKITDLLSNQQITVRFQKRSAPSDHKTNWSIVCEATTEKHTKSKPKLQISKKLIYIN